MNSAAVELLERVVGPTTALVTPMTPTFEVSLPDMATHIEYQLEQGTQALLPCGTVGEFPSLTMEERARLLELTIRQCHGRAAIFVNITSDRQAETATLAEHAARAQADALLVMMPPFYQLNLAEQREFLSWVDGLVHLPFVLYASREAATPPPTPETLEWCLGLRWFAGIKDASGDVGRLQVLQNSLGEAALVVNAAERVLVEAALAGVTRSMTATSCFAPDRVRSVLDYVRSGDEAAAKTAFAKIQAFRALFDHPGIQGRPRYLPWSKAACDLRDLPAGPPRPPMSALTPDERRALGEVLSTQFACQ